jgi:hypothetical protein
MTTVSKIVKLETGELMAGEFVNHAEAVRYAAYLNKRYPRANGGLNYAAVRVVASKNA